MSPEGAPLRFRLSLRLPEGTQPAALASNWSDMFHGLPRDTTWDVEVQDEEELAWLIADFLALHAPAICEAAGVSDFEAVPAPEQYVELSELP
jgi:hypothetical protein